MTYQVSVTKKGQMTIPKEVREKLGIKTPDRVKVKLNEDNETLKIERIADIAELAGKFKASPGKDALAARKHMEENYKRG